MAEVFVDLSTEVLHEASETKLIAAVKQSNLYKSAIPSGKTSKRWIQIAEQCNKTVSESLKIWDSLLQAYFSASPDTDWPYYAELKKLEPYLSNHSVQNPSNVQKHVLLQELLWNCSIINSNYSTPQQRQNMWLIIVSKCNKIKPGIVMSNAKWQEYWLNMKYKFYQSLSSKQSKLANGIRFNIKQFTSDENLICNIFGVLQWSSFDVIASALANNNELGICKDNFSLCQFCHHLRTEISCNGLCWNCRVTRLNLCDLCENSIEGEILKYDVKDWSQKALDLLGLELSSNLISLCCNCSNQINKKATEKWKTCRICNLYDSNLEFLYKRTKLNIRKLLSDATQFPFSEFDGLPGYICKFCNKKIEDFNKFCTKFIETQSELQKIHSKHFIGVVFNKKQEIISNNDIISLDTNIKKNNDVNNTSEAAQKIPQKRQHTRKPTNCVEVLNKENSEAIDSETETITHGGINQIPVIPELTLAIKNVYSLNSGVQQQKLPVTGLQTSKVDTNILDSSKPSQKSSSKTRTKEISTFQPGNNQMSSNIDTTEHIFTASQPGSKNQFAKEHNEIQPIIGKLQTFVSSIPMSKPHNSMTTNSSTSNQALTTLYDYETIDDAPPVFCIPKNSGKTLSNDNHFLNAKKQLNYKQNPSATELIVDDNHPSNNSTTTSNQVLQEGSTIKKTAPVNLRNHQELPQNPITKIIRMNGAMVAVQPHPSISGAFVPIDFVKKKGEDNQNKMSSTNNAKTEQKSQATNDSKKNSQQAKIVTSPNLIHPPDYATKIQTLQIDLLPTITPPAPLQMANAQQAFPSSSWVEPRKNSIYNSFQNPPKVQLEQEIIDLDKIDDVPNAIGDKDNNNDINNINLFAPDTIDVSLMISGKMIQNSLFAGDLDEYILSHANTYGSRKNQEQLNRINEKENKNNTKEQNLENKKKEHNTDINEKNVKTKDVVVFVKLRKLRIKLKRYRTNNKVDFKNLKYLRPSSVLIKRLSRL